MARAALRVAGRRLSQQRRAGAPVLFRQVTAGGARDGITEPGRRHGQNPGVLKNGNDLGARASEPVPGSFTEDGAGDPGLGVLESGYSWVLVE